MQTKLWSYTCFKQHGPVWGVKWYAIYKWQHICQRGFITFFSRKAIVFHRQVKLFELNFVIRKEQEIWPHSVSQISEGSQVKNLTRSATWPNKLQSNQVKRTPQDYINELTIWILNSLVISKIDITLIFLNIKPISCILGMTSGFSFPIINSLM